MKMLDIVVAATTVAVVVVRMREELLQAGKEVMLFCVSRDTYKCRVKYVITQQYKRHTPVLLFRCEVTDECT